jgi:hypothetical protein
MERSRGVQEQQRSSGIGEVMSDLDLSVWAHRWSDFYPKVIGSIARYVKESYNLITLIEPGNCHQNMQRVLDRGRSRILCFMDEDIELLDEYTIPRMRDVLLSSDEIAMIVPVQIFERHLARDYRDFVEAKGPHPNPESTVKLINMCAAYSMMVDREKLPKLYADTKIPGIKGFTDCDLSMQVHAAGYKLALLSSGYIYHENKKKWSVEKFKEYQSPLPWGRFPEEKALADTQREYLQKKWADHREIFDKGFGGEFCWTRDILCWD